MRCRAGRTTVAALALAILAACVMLVSAGPVSADDSVTIVVKAPDLVAVGDEFTATVDVAFPLPQPPADSTLHISYDPSVLYATSFDQLRCVMRSPGAVDCPVGGNWSGGSFVRFRVLQFAQTTITGTINAISGSGTVNGPPTMIENRSPPVISGQATVGGTLTATSGTWWPTYPFVFSYVWLRCAPANNSCATLNATGASYPVTQADMGCSLEVIVFATAGPNSIGGRSDPSPIVPGDHDCVAHPDPLPAPPPPPPTAPPEATFRLIDSVPHALQHKPYQADLDACTYVTTCTSSNSFRVVLASGELPPGLKLATTAIDGTPTTPGTYTFTIEGAQDLGARGVARLRHDYTLIVEPDSVATGSDVGTSELILPDTTRTPGATNPAVRQATVKRTICVSAWIVGVRPPASFTNALKLKQMKQYGETGRPAAFAEDHLIPLELGGAPRNPKNLWPEPRSQATFSEPFEAVLKRKVCAGSLSLAAARKQILAFKRANG